MAVDNFIYQGINRAVSDYTGARACEELINLRPTEGGLVPVKDFNAVFSNVDWDKVFVHYTTTGRRYIVVKHTSTAVQVYYLSNEADPTSLVSLFSVTGLSSAGVQDVLDHLYFAAAGNVVAFSVCAPTAGKYENHAFTWKYDDTAVTPGLRYVAVEANVPSVTYSVSATLETAQTSILKLDGDTEAPEIIESVQSGLNAIQEENPDICFGPVIIAMAFKTSDGKTFWSGGWRVYDPIPSANSDSRFYLTAASDWNLNDYYVDGGFYTSHGGHAYSLIPLANSGTEGGVVLGALKSITVPGTKVTLTFPAVSGWNKNTSIIRSVEVYASKPAFFLDASASADGFHYKIYEGSPFSAAGSTLILPQVKYADMDLGGQLLYHQASIPMESLAASSQTVRLTFGGSAQMGEEMLDADAGALVRYGRILSYNARFHYYDSVAKVKIDKPFLAFPPSGASTVNPDLFVRYADDDQSGLVYLGKYGSNVPVTESAYCVVAPSLNVREVIEYFPYAGGYVARTYRMTASTSYNFAISQGDMSMETSATPITQYAGLISGGVNDVVTNVETDVINVSEQYNPFVFRVEHSYKAPGNIIDVQPQMAGIADASYGRDPLNVFTERGLYALTQGSANVLYGAFLPLSNLKAQRGGIPVEAGTFFLADGNLWLVSGRRVTLVSEALSLGPHKYVRACTGYKKLSGTDTPYSPDPAPADPVYDVSPHLSQVEFKVFTTGGQLSYNRFRMELLISNKLYSYTYVLSLKNYQWHKISRLVWQDEPGSTIISIPGIATGTISILDMSSEVSTSQTPLLIHMQSRPFSMGYQYSHIHRIVTMMRAKLPSSSEKLAVGLYGSDDLQNWNLLSYGKWSGKTENNTNTPLFLSQLRTPSSARSWRYYTVCVGGYIPVNPDFPTDIGPVLVDYEPVVRRLG